MTIKSTFVWTSVHTAIKILSGIIMNKIIAVYLGPAGLAMIGQFQNFVGIVSSVANGSIQTGIVKYTAQYKDDTEYLNKLMKNSLIIILFLSFIVSLFLLLFANYLSVKIMFSNEYTNIIYFLAFSMVFYSLNLYLLSILNGLGELKLFTGINILISIFSLFLVSILTILYKLDGALLAIILVQSFIFIIAYILVYRKFGNKFFNFKGIYASIDKKVISNLLKFSVATFSSGVIISVMLIAIRYIITDEISIVDAGIWEGAWRMMVYFNMLFMLPFSIYYLPKFSASNKIKEINNYLLEAFKFLIPLSILLAIFIYTFKSEIIYLLFSEEFIKIEILLIYMLCAEFFRILALSISNIFMAKVQVVTVISTELIFALVLIGLSFVLMDDFGLIGIGYAYLISSIIFFGLYMYKFKDIDILVNKN